VKVIFGHYYTCLCSSQPILLAHVVNMQHSLFIASNKIGTIGSCDGMSLIPYKRQHRVGADVGTTHVISKLRISTFRLIRPDVFSL
jgi:hypothetical protein